MIGCPRSPLLSHFTSMLYAHRGMHTAEVNEQALCRHTHTFVPTVIANIAIMCDYQWLCSSNLNSEVKSQYTLLAEGSELNCCADGSG